MSWSVVQIIGQIIGAEYTNYQVRITDGNREKEANTSFPNAYNEQQINEALDSAISLLDPDLEP